MTLRNRIPDEDAFPGELTREPPARLVVLRGTWCRHNQGGTNGGVWWDFPVPCRICAGTPGTNDPAVDRTPMATVVRT